MFSVLFEVLPKADQSTAYLKSAEKQARAVLQLFGDQRVTGNWECLWLQTRD